MFKKCEYVPILESKRLVLRELNSEDADDLQEWFGLDKVYTYWGHPPGVGEKNVASLFIDPRPHVKRKPSKDFIWAIVEKETSKVIGIIEVFDVENNRMGTVGYRLNPKTWDQGYCTEALSRVIEFIFLETKMDRLWTTIDVRNTGSNRVVEKNGFIHEGTVRHGKFGIRYCDYNIWGLLREDFENIAAEK